MFFTQAVRDKSQVVSSTVARRFSEGVGRFAVALGLSVCAASRSMSCGGVLVEVAKQQVADKVSPRSYEWFEQFC